MARVPLFAGNWKMHGTRAAATELAGALAQHVGAVTGREVLIAPPYTALDAAREAIAGTRILLGAQNVHGEDKGAYTGEISAAMLVEAGCTHVIIGHSERRQYYGETDAGVNARLRGALRAGLVPIVCVGETLAEREAGTTMAVIERQVRGGIAGIDAVHHPRIVLAYEPVWAIGTGRTATREQAQEVHLAIRNLVAELTGPAVASGMRILYGGSVKPDNIDALMAQPDLDGALVGGASLDAVAFARIVQYQESRP
jgi:triosephosphate isomerase (TIM)